MKSLKNNAGQSSSSSKILEKLWHVFVMNSSSGAAYEAPTTGKPKQTNLLSNFQEFLDEEELCSARFLIDFMLQNVIQNWKMKNFHQKSYLRNCLVSYLTLGIVWPCPWPLSTITNISTHTYLYYKYIRDDPNCVKACHLLHLRWKKKNIAAASKQSMIKEKNFKKLWFWLLR